jgi:uncharacterized protein YraI
MKFTPRLLCHAFSLCLLAGAATTASATPAYVPTTVNLRAAPGTTSEIVSKIPGGSLIDADKCTEGWCAVTWQGKSGFAKETALDMTGRVPQRSGAQYPTTQRRVHTAQPNQAEVYEDDGDVVVEGPPPVYYGPRPYYYGYGPYYRGGWGWRHRW